MKKQFAFFRMILPPCLQIPLFRFGEIVVNYPNIGKTLNSIDLVNLMSSISVRFNSFLFLYSIFNEHKANALLSEKHLAFFAIGFRGFNSSLNVPDPWLPTLSGGRSGWTRTIDLTLIRRAL